MSTNFSKLGNPGCGCCTHTEPTGCSTFCVNVLQGSTLGIGDNPPVSGISVTIFGTLAGSPWSTSGTTSGSGFCYTKPTTGSIPTVLGATVTACGFTATGYFGGDVDGTCSVTFYLCQITINATITSAAAPTIDSFPYYFTQTGSGSALTLTYCNLQAYYPTNPFPATITLTATSTIDCTYPSKCVTLTVDCQGTYDVDLTQDYWGDCYFSACDCDLGCDWGPGPSFRGLVSKKIECQWNSGPVNVCGYGPFHPATCSAGPIPYFADDEGQWITIDGAVTYDSFGHPTGWIWDTGCRSAMGNFVSSNDPCGGIFCYLNHVPPYAFTTIPYQSTRIIITQGSVLYGRYPLGDCTYDERCVNVPCEDCCIGYGCGCQYQSGNPDGTPDGTLCSPCITGGYGEFGAYTSPETITNPVSGVPTFFQFRTLVCTPMDFCVGMNADGYGGSAPFWAETSLAESLFIGSNTMWYVRIRETC